MAHPGDTIQAQLNSAYSSPPISCFGATQPNVGDWQIVNFNLGSAGQIVGQCGAPNGWSVSYNSYTMIAIINIPLSAAPGQHSADINISAAAMQSIGIDIEGPPSAPPPGPHPPSCTA